MITSEELRQLLDYDPTTGVFRNRMRRSNCVREGQIAGHVNSKGYRIIKIRGKAYKAHRLVFLHTYGRWPEDQIDHINGEKDDNRLENLRVASGCVNAQNQRRAPRHSTSGVLGAQKGGWKGRRWVSEIQYRGQRLYLGVFNTPEEASAAYLEAKRRFHEGCTL